MKRPSDPYSVVYFIQAGDAGPFKIGKTTVNAHARMEEFQTGNHCTLYLRLQISGSNPGGGSCSPQCQSLTPQSFIPPLA